MHKSTIRSRKKATVKRKLISALLSCWFATVAAGRAQTLDQEMSGLADKIGKALVAKGCKNVAALDFTDLQGQPTELGRFLSEQLGTCQEF
jgi:hypothetical protein